MQAVNVLGMQGTMKLFQNIALRQSMGGGQSFEKFWERSSLTAGVAEKLAQRLLPTAKDDAYLAALFHDSGIPALMMKFPQYRETVRAGCSQGLPICQVEESAFYTNHAIVGCMITRTWNLPQQVSKAIRHHHDASIFSTDDKQVSDEERNLIGLVHMAEYIIDEHLNVRDKEWPQFAQGVLAHYDLSEQEFAELNGDMLAYLNDE